MKLYSAKGSLDVRMIDVSFPLKTSLWRAAIVRSGVVCMARYRCIVFEAENVVQGFAEI